MAEAARTLQDAGSAGLTSDDARNLLRVHGPNQLPDTGTVLRWQRLGRVRALLRPGTS